MKCPRCRTDSDYRARKAHGGACKGCRRPFVFEPRQGDAATDLMFERAIDAVSDEGRLSWTDRHLYYEICRRVRRRRVLHWLLRRKTVSLDHATFLLLLERWIAASGDYPGRLRTEAFGEAEPHRALGEEVSDYGFEHVLVCQHDQTADLLIANRFHTEHKCPVLSVRGHPRHAYDALIPILRRRPPETVLVVHDADWDGCRLATRVGEDTRWFGGVDTPRVIDAGLRPADARRFRGLYLHAVERVQPAADVPPDDAKWLNRYRLELAAVRPRVTVAVLGRALRTELETTAGNGGDGAVWYGATWGDGDDDVG